MGGRYFYRPTRLPKALPLRSRVAPLRCSLSYDSAKIVKKTETAIGRFDVQPFFIDE